MFLPVLYIKLKLKRKLSLAYIAQEIEIEGGFGLDR